MIDKRKLCRNGSCAKSCQLTPRITCTCKFWKRKSFNIWNKRRWLVFSAFGTLCLVIQIYKIFLSKVFVCNVYLICGSHLCFRGVGNVIRIPLIVYIKQSGSIKYYPLGVVNFLKRFDEPAMSQQN